MGVSPNDIYSSCKLSDNNTCLSLCGMTQETSDRQISVFSSQN